MFKKWQQLANVDVLNRSGWSLYKNGTIDWELLYVNNFEGTLSRLGQFTHIWIANVMTDENFVVEAEFMRKVSSRIGWFESSKNRSFFAFF
jgi:hypothetical protein